jgi:hypothetical protein
LIVVLLISSFFNLINTSLEGGDFQFNLGIFDYQGLSAAAEWFTLLGALVIYIFYTRQQDDLNDQKQDLIFKAQEEQRLEERRAMKWQSTDVLRWSMDNLAREKQHFRRLFNNFKHEMDSILITSYEFSVSEEDKYNLKPITDEARISYIKNLSIVEQEKFYQEVKDIDLMKIADAGGDEGKESLIHASIELQRNAYLCLFEFIPKQHLINLWGQVILAGWYSMEGYIKHERCRLGEGSAKHQVSPEDYIKMFDFSEDGTSPKHYQGPQFRIVLELLAQQMEEGLLPLRLVNKEREKYGRPPLEG